MPRHDLPRLRTDAERNRTAVLEAARAVFADNGLDAPIAEIARRAGVGIATLYRRFPTREDLIAELFDDKMSDYVKAVTAAVEDDDPWRGFCTNVELVCRMQYEDRGFADVLTTAFPQAESLEAKRSAAYRGFEKLVANAKSVGRLRQEFRPQDLVVMLMANAGLVDNAGAAAPAASRRLVSWILAACDTRHAHPLAPAPTKRQMQDALQGRHCQNVSGS
jgi:AcrR family transcriptional regulator